MTVGILSASGLVEIDESSEGAALALSAASGMSPDKAAEYLEDLAFERALLYANSADAAIELMERCVNRDDDPIAKRNVALGLVFALSWLRLLRATSEKGA